MVNHGFGGAGVQEIDNVTFQVRGWGI